jgi:hypothetical protein
MAAIDDLRTAERAFLRTGDERHLDQAEALVETGLRAAPFAPATGVWLRLLRYDRAGDDRHLDAAAGACRASGGQDPILAGVTVAVQLRLWARDGDAAELDHAIGLSGDAGQTGPGPGRGRYLPLWLTPAWRAADAGCAYLERSRLNTAEDDLSTAREMLRAAVRGAPEPAIRALAERHLAACEQELYLRSGQRRLLDQAIRRYQRVLAKTGEHAVVRPMLLTELGTALQDRFARDGDPDDIDRAVALAAEAVTEAAAIGACRPDLACHLVNFGTALNTRYEQAGDPEDLAAALRHWTGALDAVAPMSAYRPAFLDRLALGLLMRWEYENSGEEDLDAAIGYSRAAARDGADSQDAAVYACHLADALEHRWEMHRDPADLHEAVRVFAAAMSSLRGDGASTADLVCNYAHTLLARYQAMGGAEDLAAALGAVSRVPSTDLSRSQRAAIAAVTARARSMRYEAAGDPDDLGAAIATARQALAGTGSMSTTRNSRTARLGHLLYLRYACCGRRRDLDEAIALLRGLSEAADGYREASPDQLSQLSGYLAARYQRDGDPADQEAATRFSRRARESDRRDEEPSVDTTLAAVLHDRFSAEGGLDDLDEAIARYREALARQIPTAPVYPAMLSNLGLALQDCYLYRDDDAALEEAIALHERAVAACPPRSPDRAGYLGTLAAAVQLRFERDRRAADLSQVISLGEQALACLGPRAPERATLLASLAAARHLRARDSSDPADFDCAIAAYRAALRRLRDNCPARPLVLSGYARALGDCPAGSGPAVVLRAFRQALAATGQAPVVQLDVASSLGEWALQSRLWQQAAEAYQAAAAARRTLSGAQLSRAYRDTWLAHSQDIPAAEASAWAHCGQPRQAATALDAGRALALSEALDARSVTSSLRALGRHELAARYEAAALQLERAAAPSAASFHPKRMPP